MESGRILEASNFETCIIRNLRISRLFSVCFVADVFVEKDQKYQFLKIDVEKHQISNIRILQVIGVYMILNFLQKISETDFND